MSDDENFQDDFEKNLQDAAAMSDEELELLMGGASGAQSSFEQSVNYEELESGARVEGLLVEVRESDVLVELDGKTLGLIDVEEFDLDTLPEPGDRVQAEFVQWDPARDLCVLTTRAVRAEIAWEELRPGLLVEGEVVDTNRGGLVVDIKGMRAFMPISQIDRARVEDTQPWVGRRVSCEVVQVERAERNLVVSRRAILEREAEAEREETLGKIQEGQVLRGRVTQVNRHGAFVDIGGADGLLHVSKIVKQFGGGDENALKIGEVLDVEIIRIDRERGRIGLDFVAIEEDSWDSLIESYAVGDDVTGWISRHEGAGIVLSVEGGLDMLIPSAEIGAASTALEVGQIVSARITSIDAANQRVLVKPLP